MLRSNTTLTTRDQIGAPAAVIAAVMVCIDFYAFVALLLRRVL